MEKTNKEIKYCPAHGYPLPCEKCGYGLREATAREIFDKIDAWLKQYGHLPRHSYEEYKATFNIPVAKEDKK